MRSHSAAYALPKALQDGRPAGRAKSAKLDTDADTYFDERELNAHDSLGEAYMKAVRAADAIRSCERSLQLNPNYTNARQMLEALKRWARYRLLCSWILPASARHARW